MTEAARKLRRADEQQLRLALAVLRHGGRFIVIVADEATWPEVRDARALAAARTRFIARVPGAARGRDRLTTATEELAPPEGEPDS